MFITCMCYKMYHLRNKDFEIGNGKLECQNKFLCNGSLVFLIWTILSLSIT